MEETQGRDEPDADGGATGGRTAHIGPVDVAGIVTLAGEAQVAVRGEIRIGAVLSLDAPRGALRPGAAAALRFVGRRGPLRAMVVVRRVEARPHAREVAEAQVLTEPVDAAGREANRTPLSLSLRGRLVRAGAPGASVAIAVTTVDVAPAGIFVDIGQVAAQVGDVLGIEFPGGAHAAGFRVVRVDPSRRGRVGAVAVEPQAALEFARECVEHAAQAHRDALAEERRRRELEQAVQRRSSEVPVEERARRRMHIRQVPGPGPT